MKFDNAIDDWEMSTLGSMCSRITTGSTPSRSVDEYFNGHIPWVKTQELLDSGIEHCEEHITELALKRTSVKLLPVNTVLMAMYGATVGKLGITKVPVTCNQACCAFIPDDSVLNFRFLFYLLLQNRDGIRSLATGAAQQNLSVSTIKEYQFRFPPIQEQKAIAHILGTLDDKIDQLRKTNSVLEDMASALFKSWFIDFDPVKAKQENRPTGLPKDVDDLFPDSFEDSALGPIPTGWRVGCVGDIAKVVYGAAFASKLFNSNRDGLPLIRIRDLKSGIPQVYTTEQHPKGRLVMSGEILVGMDGEFRATVWTGEPAWLNQRVCLFQPLAPAAHDFVRLSIMPLLARVEATETATTVIHLGKSDIDGFKFVLPTTQLIQMHRAASASNYERRTVNTSQIRTLTNLRDTLLPKLISGDLRVPEAEQMVAELGL